MAAAAAVVGPPPGAPAPATAPVINRYGDTTFRSLTWVTTGSTGVRLHSDDWGLGWYGSGCDTPDGTSASKTRQHWPPPRRKQQASFRTVVSCCPARGSWTHGASMGPPRARFCHMGGCGALTGAGRGGRRRAIGAAALAGRCNISTARRRCTCGGAARRPATLFGARRVV
jgi:hypothetical protein